MATYVIPVCKVCKNVYDLGKWKKLNDPGFIVFATFVAIGYVEIRPRFCPDCMVIAELLKGGV